MNDYIYASNNPITNNDPLGLYYFGCNWALYYAESGYKIGLGIGAGIGIPLGIGAALLSTPLWAVPAFVGVSGVTTAGVGAIVAGIGFTFGFIKDIGCEFF